MQCHVPRLVPQFWGIWKSFNWILDEVLQLLLRYKIDYADNIFIFSTYHPAIQRPYMVKTAPIEVKSQISKSFDACLACGCYVRSFINANNPLRLEYPWYLYFLHQSCEESQAWQRIILCKSWVIRWSWTWSKLVGITVYRKLQKLNRWRMFLTVVAATNQHFGMKPSVLFSYEIQPNTVQNPGRLPCFRLDRTLVIQRRRAAS